MPAGRGNAAPIATFSTFKISDVHVQLLTYNIADIRFQKPEVMTPSWRNRYDFVYELGGPIWMKFGIGRCTIM